MITLSGNQIIQRTNNRLLILEPYGPNCIRCRMTRNSKISDEKWTLLDAQPTEYEISQDGESARLVVGDLRVDVEAAIPWYPSRLVFYRKNEPILYQAHYGDTDNTFIHTEGDHYKTTIVFVGTRNLSSYH